jgi:hypothetical protein
MPVTKKPNVLVDAFKILKAVPAPKIKPSVEEVKTLLPTIGTRRVRKEWKALADQIKKSSNFDEVLALLHDLIETPKYATAKASAFDPASGKPTEVKWVRDKAGMGTFAFVDGQTSEIKFPELFKERMRDFLEDYEMGIVQASLYMTKGTVEVPRCLTVSFKEVSTGGGHNDSISYATAVVITPVILILETLPGNAFL